MISIFIFGSSSFANEIKGFAVGQTLTAPGSQISFVIEAAKASQSSSLWCGVNVDFGNGSSIDIRLGQNGDADLRKTLQYAYPNPGTYTATLSGKMLTRGLMSAAECKGAPQKVNIKVVDPEISRMQIELERTKREQSIRDQEVREAAGRIARENIERQKLLDQKLLELETQKKQQEVEAKTQELERKIRELEQAKNKAAVPIRQAPAKKDKADSIL